MIRLLILVEVGLAVGGKPILHDLNLHVLPGEIYRSRLSPLYRKLKG